MMAGIDVKSCYLLNWSISNTMDANFLCSPSIEGQWIGWYAAGYGYDGFLRWAYDAWPQDPDRDARHASWAAGDCYLVYPGGNSGIRFAKLRQGIADYEKIRIVRALASASTDKKCHELLNALDMELNTVSHERTFNEDTLKKQVYEGQKLLSEISDRLARKKQHQ